MSSAVTINKGPMLAVSIGLFFSLIVFCLIMKRVPENLHQQQDKIDGHCASTMSSLQLHKSPRIGGHQVFNFSRSCLENLIGRSYKPRKDFGETSVYGLDTTHCFKRVFVESEKAPFVEKIATFARVMDRYNFTWFLIGGSLIGSLRHHGITPWDDDIDVLVEYKQRKSIWNVLKSLEPQGFELTQAPFVDGHYKFRVQGLHPKYSEVKNYRFCIDLFFFHVNDSHVWYEFTKPLYVSRGSVLPLVRRPFEGLLLPTPRNSFEYLSKEYNSKVLERCVYSSYANLESSDQCAYKDEYNINCSQLTAYYPFVKVFHVTGGGDLELLVQGDLVFQSAYIPDP